MTQTATDAQVNATVVTIVDWPAPRIAWYGLAILMLAALVAILDRQILSLLVDPIKTSLGLSDVQMGMLQGPAFMIFYTVFGLPIGWLVDRTHRLRLISAGIGIWTIGTVFCGLADSYVMMFAARALVGMGEAVVSPGSLSLIADYFAPNRRPVAMSIHGTAAMFGTGLAFLSGGGLLALAGAASSLSIFGTPLEGWRFVMLASALPGAVAFVLTLSAREPARQEQVRQESDAGIVDFLWGARAWVLTHFGGICILAAISFAFLTWAPTYVVRLHGWSASDVGLMTGLQFLILGPLGILAGGMLVRRQQHKGDDAAALRVLRMVLVALVASMVCLALPWGPVSVFLPMGLAIFVIAMSPSISAMAVQQATPNRFRGRTAALYFIITNLVGSSLGPLVTAALTQHVFQDPKDLGFSFATLALIGGPAVYLLLSLAQAPYARLAAANR